jgi:hypothetical protein
MVNQHEMIMNDYLVSIPVLDIPVFTAREEVMRIGYEGNLHDTIIMSKDSFMAISKVQPPNLDILIRRSCDEQRIVVAYVQRHYREFVSIERQEELQGVLIVYLQSYELDGW